MLIHGATIGPYQIVSSLGAGGMGEVYRARDTRLKRDVALKILPDSLASDPDRLARLQREAEVLASLNHPNIAHIHGLEEAAGTRALVMELVEGEDLAARIASGPIPVDEALPIARQIAEPGVVNHGVMGAAGFRALVAESSFLVGVGDPVSGLVDRCARGGLRVREPALLTRPPASR